MNIQKLKEKLSQYGYPLIVKEGVVFTVLIKGIDLHKWKIVNAIQTLVLDYAGEKFPIIEAMVNDSSVFCMVLRSDNYDEF
jgi:hypothetical protein